MLKSLLIFTTLFVLGIANAQVISLRKFRKTEKDSLERAVMLLDQKQYLLCLPLFENLYTNHPEEEFIKYSYAKAALYKPETQTNAFSLLKQVYEKNRKAPDIQYYMALGAYYNYFFDDALIYISTYSNSKFTKPEAKLNAEAFKQTIMFARYFYTHPGRAVVSLLNAPINSEFNENTPALSANDSLLIFSYAGNKSKGILQKGLGANYYYNEDVCVAKKIEGEFVLQKSAEYINTDQKEIALSLSNDGQLLFLKNSNNNGDLFSSRWNGFSFCKPERLKGNINSEYNESYCSLSPDGKTLYFSSNRPGGKGGLDLYKASLSADSTWVNVLNLGDSVNTAADEEAPFIHADGRTLYFSSKGKNSMGGYDVFRALLNSKDSLFKRIENLGYPINTPYDDVYFTLSANGETGYYSSYRKEGKGMSDVYKVETDLRANKPSLCLLTGKIYVKNRTSKAVLVVLKINGLEREFCRVNNNPSNAQYLVAIPTGNQYKLIYQVPGYKTKEMDLDLSDMQGYMEKTKDIQFDPAIDSIVAKPVVVAPPVQKKILADTTKLTVAEAVITSTALKEKLVENQTEEKEAHVDSLLMQLNTRVKSTASVVSKEPVPKAEVFKKTENTKTDTVLSASTETNSVEKAFEAVSNLTLSAKSIKEQIVELEKTLQKREEEEKAEEQHTKRLLILKADSIRIASILNAKKTETLTDIKNNEKNIEPFKTPSTTNETIHNQNIAISVSTTISSTNPVVIESTKEEFTPHNKVHKKIMEYVEKYGDITHDYLEFKVQITAYKNNNHYYFPELVKFGKIEKLELGDGYKRLMQGGSFSSIRRAFNFAKKIVQAGHDEIYIIAFYKGQRKTIEELEDLGILK